MTLLVGWRPAWGAGMVMFLEQGADLHMAQLLPLPLTVSCFSKIQIDFTFLALAHPASPGKRAVKCMSASEKNLIKLVNIWQNCRKEGGLHVADREQKAVSYDNDDADAYNRSFCGLCSMDSVKIFLSVK